MNETHTNLTGKTAILRGRKREMDIAVRITDSRSNFGRVDYLVTPVSGTGSVWVSAERVTIQNESEVKQ